LRGRARGSNIDPMSFLLTFWSFALVAATIAAVIAAYVLPPDEL
jgi:hypothetical protein